MCGISLCARCCSAWRLCARLLALMHLSLVPGQVKFFCALRTPAGHWFFALDFSAYFWVDLKKPQTLQLLHIEKTTLNQEELVIEARPFRGGARLIWRGHTEKVPDTFDWEKEDRVSKKDADDGGSESSSTSDGEEDDEPNKKSCGAPEPAASRHAPKPPASSRHQQRRGSNQDWVRPLVLGHVAT